MKARLSNVEYIEMHSESEHKADQESAYSSELAVRAASLLFTRGCTAPREVDYLILCTQTPDFLLPTTACLVQAQLGLGSSIGAIDISGGPSGFVHALALARGLILSDQAKSVLVLTADTCEPSRGAASATIVFADSANENRDRFEFGTHISGGLPGLQSVDAELLVNARADHEQDEIGASAIPIALADAIDQGRLHRGDRVVLVGTDVDGSWAGMVTEW